MVQCCGCGGWCVCERDRSHPERSEAVVDRLRWEFLAGVWEVISCSLETSMSDRLKVCICGGGNGAHVMSVLAAVHERAPDVRVLTLYGNEAAEWTAKLAEEDMIIVKQHQDGPIEEIKGKPAIVTNDASKAVPGADLIIFCVPAFAHQQYFEAIYPHMGDNASIIGLPGQPGFEFQCLHILKEKGKNCIILSYESLPWVCRISEFGRKIEMKAAKKQLTGSRVSGGRTQLEGEKDPACRLQSLLGENPVLSEVNNYLETTLLTRAFMHPPVMYGTWKDWDGKPLSKKPLFYQGLSEYAASLMSKISDEIVETARAISKAKPEVKMTNVKHLQKGLIRDFHSVIGDQTSLFTVMKTNAAYDGLLHPMKEISPGQFVPDFQHRYLAEDVPFGLAVVKGVAQIAGVSTPATDEVLTWAQGRMGKEFMVGSEFKGKDVKDTRAPQAFGLNSLDDLLAIM